MSLHKLSAGHGYDYLIRQVARPRWMRRIGAGTGPGELLHGATAVIDRYRHQQPLAA